MQDGPLYNRLDENNLKTWPKEHGGGAPSPVRFKINADGSQKLESASARRKRVTLRRKEEDARAKLASAAKAEEDRHAVRLHMQQLEKKASEGKKGTKRKKSSKKDDDGESDESGSDGQHSDTKACAHFPDSPNV